MKQRIPTAIAIIFGWFTFLGLLIGPGFPVHHYLVRWAAALAAVAFVIGVLNLVGVHIRRIANLERDWVYSIFLLLAFVAVAFVAFVGNEGPAGGAVSWIFHAVLSPLEAAAASLLIFFLVAAAFRSMRKRPTWPTLIFVLTIIFVLLGTLPFSGDLGQMFGSVRDWLVNVFAMAGARGILLGVALGTIVTGLRVLVGIDRPHSEREP